MGITVCRFFSTYLIYNPFFLNFPLKVIVLYNKIARPIHTINSDIKLLTLWYKILLIIQTLTYMYTFNHAIMTIKKLLKICVNCIKCVYSGLITLVCFSLQQNQSHPKSYGCESHHPPWSTRCKAYAICKPYFLHIVVRPQLSHILSHTLRQWITRTC